MTANFPTISERRPDNPAPKRCHGLTLIEVMIVFSIICLLAALLLPAVQQARESARRYNCRTNLMQIGLALRNYESAHGLLPPGSVNASRPIRNVARGYHFGWIVHLLPYLEKSAQFERVDFSVGVYDPRNSTALSGGVGLGCPSSFGGGIGYAGCHHDVEAPIDIDNSGVLFLNSCISQDDVVDGISHTIFVGEKNDAAVFGWASGTRDTLRNTGTPIVVGGGGLPGASTAVAGPGANVLYVGGFGSYHAGGAHFLLGDGSARFIADGISMSVFQQLGNRADRRLPADDF